MLTPADIWPLSATQSGGFLIKLKPELLIDFFGGSHKVQLQTNFLREFCVFGCKNGQCLLYFTHIINMRMYKNAPVPNNSVKELK